MCLAVRGMEVAICFLEPISVSARQRGLTIKDLIHVDDHRMNFELNTLIFAFETTSDIPSPWHQHRFHAN